MLSFHHENVDAIHYLNLPLLRFSVMQPLTTNTARRTPPTKIVQRTPTTIPTHPEKDSEDRRQKVNVTLRM